MVRKLHHPNVWKNTKYVSWPMSWSKPMIRVPLPSGSYITRSVSPLTDELDTIKECKRVRDQLAIPIWGAKRWSEILSVPARSVSRPRKQPKTPFNGIQLIERKGRSAHYLVTWYELDEEGSLPTESQTHGKQYPRRPRRKAFSFGTKTARYASQQVALDEAVAFAKRKQRQAYSVIHIDGKHYINLSVNS